MSEIITETVTREADILADTYEDVRSLLKFYLMKAKNLDPFKVYEIEGRKLNTLYWLVAHVAWSQHFLLIEAMGGEALDIPWLTRFEIGSMPPSGDDLPSYPEVREALDRVHARAMETVRALTDTDLSQPNAVGIDFRGGDAKRVVIRHAIRHEPCHIGQIGWLIKLAGGETV
jgi:hypothetical protein